MAWTPNLVLRSVCCPKLPADKDSDHTIQQQQDGWSEQQVSLDFRRKRSLNPGDDYRLFLRAEERGEAVGLFSISHPPPFSKKRRVIARSRGWEPGSAEGLVGAPEPSGLRLILMSVTCHQMLSPGPCHSVCYVCTELTLPSPKHPMFTAPRWHVCPLHPTHTLQRRARWGPPEAGP